MPPEEKISAPGFGIIEAMVGVLVASVVALGISRMLDLTTSSQAGISLVTAINGLTQTAGQIVSDKTACTLNFAGKSLDLSLAVGAPQTNSSFSNLVLSYPPLGANPPGRALGVGDKLTGGVVSALTTSILGASGSNYYLSLTIEVKKDASSSGASVLTRKVNFNAIATTVGGVTKISSCVGGNSGWITIVPEPLNSSAVHWKINGTDTGPLTFTNGININTASVTGVSTGAFIKSPDQFCIDSGYTGYAGSCRGGAMPPSSTGTQEMGTILSNNFIMDGTTVYWCIVCVYGALAYTVPTEIMCVR